MQLVLSITPHTSKRVAELAFLLILFAGVWMAAADIPALRLARHRRMVSGVALAGAGLLLIVATHFGKFG